MNKNTKTTEQFLQELKSLFGDYYDYSQVEYVHSKTNVHIICPLHGDSFRKPNKIFTSGFACKGCGILSKTSTKDLFIQKAILKHGYKYDYSSVTYINSYTKINIRCKKHNVIVNMDPNSHLKGYFNCHQCKIKSTDQYIKDAKRVHGDLYNYSKVDYKGALNTIKVICKTHGVFEQTASVHLSGSGCSLCNCYNGYTKSKYVDLCNKHYKGLSNFYIIKLYNKEEVFYKIGITCRDINKRYKQSHLNNYLKKDVLFIDQLPVELIFDLEKHLISKYSKYKYVPIDTMFDGKSECISILPQNYLEDVNDFISKYTYY